MAQVERPGEGQQMSGAQSTWGKRIQQMGQQAEGNLDRGAVTSSYRANREEVLDLLNRALAGEWTAFLQYYHHYTMASSIHGSEVAGVWKEHAEEEYEHAQKINERINQLGGVPANSPQKIDQLSPVPFKEGHGVLSQIKDDLVAERATIAFYDEIIRTCAFDDITTRTLFEEIVGDENEHAEELSDFLYEHDATTGQTVEVTEEMPQRRAA